MNKTYLNENLKTICFDVNNADVYISSAKEKPHIETLSNEFFITNDNELIVTGLTIKKEKISLVLDPKKSYTFKLMIMAGNIFLNKLDSNSLDLNAKLGNITIENSDFDRLDINLTAGKIDLTNVDFMHGIVDINKGNVDMKINESMKNYETFYMTNINNGDESFVQYSTEKMLDDYEKDKRFLIVKQRCGNTSINFMGRKAL